MASAFCCCNADAPTCPLPQRIGGDAWGNGWDGDSVTPRGGCRRGGAVPILDLNCKESLHVQICLSLGDLLSSCSPWGPVFLWATRGVHISFSWMPRPTHGVLQLASWQQRFVSHASWLRCGLTLGCNRGVRCGVCARPCWPVSRCAGGCCSVCKRLSCSGECYTAAVARACPVLERNLPQCGNTWALAGLGERAHAVTYRAGAVELLQCSIFLLGCC